jgi:heterodisulfide reductase subunit A
MKEPRIGVFVCWCGTNIASVIDVEKVAEEIGTLPNVVISKTYKYMCSDPGQEIIMKEIKENNLNRVVVAACSPRIHELTFRKVLENSGINGYLFEMANIREQVSWVHKDKEEATKKAKALIVGAINKVSFHESLEKRFVDINPATLVIGGGIAGISAALQLADAGQKVFIVEKNENIGGHVANIDLMFPYLFSAKQLIEPKIQKVKNHENIELFLNTQIDEVSGYVGNFESFINNGNGTKKELKFGNIVLATGLKTYDPSGIPEYKYNELPDVITSYEFEKMLINGKIQTKTGKKPKNIVIIHCVGSRDEDIHTYCSRTCCMTALKYANQVRSALPKSNIFEAYSDMRAFGKGCEEFYTRSSKKNIMFLMFDQKDGKPEIREANKNDDCSMIVEMNEKLSGEQIEIPADMVILMTAMEAQNDVKDIGHAVGVSICGSSFFIEKHPKLDPIATTTDGVFVVGSCQAPKDIPDSITQAEAASARILSSISKGRVQVEVTTAEVNEEICCGCQTCIKVCPYTAISFDEEKNVSVVNEVLCKGCGTCGSACPTGAIKCRHFTDVQILSQIEGLLSKSLSTSTMEEK